MTPFSKVEIADAPHSKLVEYLPQGKAGSEANNEIVGRSGDDVLIGNGGDDALFGNAGDDVLLGGEGADYLFGGDGDDMLFGGSGQDTLIGTTGDDSMFGGSEADMFSVSRGHGQDVIADFKPHEGDRLNLANTDHDFQNWVDVAEHAYNTKDGCVIDTGGGNSVTLLDVSVDQVVQYVIT